jgi:hypothetical protein
MAARWQIASSFALNFRFRMSGGQKISCRSKNKGGWVRKRHETHRRQQRTTYNVLRFQILSSCHHHPRFVAKVNGMVSAFNAHETTRGYTSDGSVADYGMLVVEALGAKVDPQARFTRTSGTVDSCRIVGAKVTRRRPWIPPVAGSNPLVAPGIVVVAKKTPVAALALESRLGLAVEAGEHVVGGMREGLMCGRSGVREGKGPLYSHPTLLRTNESRMSHK